jgi:tetratricopeptide (TPR) repeat protein
MNRRPKVSTISTKTAAPPAWIAAAVLALAVGVVYYPAVDAPFIFDDNSAIVDNPSIVSLWPPVGSADHPGPLNPPPQLPTAARPLVNLSFAINYKFGGLNPSGYHAVNVIIHFLSALLLWAITRRTLRLPYFADRFETSAGWLALVVAMLWALDPLQTEAVIYATQRSELMMCFFYLATLYCSLRYWTENMRRTHRAAWLTLAVFACLAGMASKEVMVSAPVVVLLFERTFVVGSLAKALRRSWPLYAGLALTWILLVALNWNNPRGATAGFGLGLPAHVWWFTQAKVLLMYLKLIVWPWPLLIHYQLPYLFTFADAWMYVFPVVLLGIATLVLLWRNHPAGFLATCVFAILAPTSLVPILSEMAADRRMYLALAAIFALLIVGGYRLAESLVSRLVAAPKTIFGFRLPVVLVALLAFFLSAGCGWASARRLAAYHDEQGLWEEVLRYEPDNHVAHQNVGFYLDKRGKTAEAIEHYREAIRLSPDSVQAHYSLGVLLTKTNPEQAVAHFTEAVRARPKDATMRNNLAFALFMAGRNNEAIEAFRATLELDPKRWIARTNMGLALQKAGKYPEALECFSQALETNPKALDIYNEVANTYALMNQPQKAVKILKQAFEIARSTGDTKNAEAFAARIEANQ